MLSLSMVDISSRRSRDLIRVQLASEVAEPSLGLRRSDKARRVCC